MLSDRLSEFDTLPDTALRDLLDDGTEDVALRVLAGLELQHRARNGPIKTLAAAARVLGIARSALEAKLSELEEPYLPMRRGSGVCRRHFHWRNADAVWDWWDKVHVRRVGQRGYRRR